jgi:amidase
MEDITYSSATALAAAIHRKEISSTEVVEAHLRRIDDVNPAINAVVQVTADEARAWARAADEAVDRGEDLGPLHGVPVTIKDAFETVGVVSAGGTKGRADFVPDQDATAVERLRAAGAIMLGKTNCPDLSLAYETDNLVYGLTRNPYDRARTPGGSSGGEGAAVAAGCSPLGLGSDAGGSIRIPSHYCGIAGIKPTRGRVPRTGHFLPPGGIADSIWQPGPMARSVDDLALALRIVSGVDWRDPSVVPMPLGDPDFVDLGGLRVTFHTDNGIAPPTPETAETVRRAAAALADTGLVVAETRPPDIEQTYELFLGLFTADGGAGLKAALQMSGTDEPHAWLRNLIGLLEANALPPGYVGMLLYQISVFRSRMLGFLEDVDVIVCPACAHPAPPVGTCTFTSVDQLTPFSYAMTYNLTGWPAAVVRGGTSPEGLPIGVQVVGRPWREDVVLAVAKVLEARLGGFVRPAL